VSTALAAGAGALCYSTDCYFMDDVIRQVGRVYSNNYRLFFDEQSLHFDYFLNRFMNRSIIFIEEINIIACMFE